MKKCHTDCFWAHQKVRPKATPTHTQKCTQCHPAHLKIHHISAHRARTHMVSLLDTRYRNTRATDMRHQPYCTRLAFAHLSKTSQFLIIFWKLTGHTRSVLCDRTGDNVEYIVLGVGITPRPQKRKERPQHRPRSALTAIKTQTHHQPRRNWRISHPPPPPHQKMHISQYRPMAAARPPNTRFGINMITLSGTP